MVRQRQYMEHDRTRPAAKHGRERCLSDDVRRRGKCLGRSSLAAAPLQPSSSWASQRARASAAIATHSGAAPTRLQPTQPNNVAPPEADDDEPLYAGIRRSRATSSCRSRATSSRATPGWDASLTSAPLWATGDEPIAEEVVVEAEMVAVTVEEEEAALASPPLQTKSEACLFDMATATPLVTAVPPPPQPPQQQEEEEEPAAAPAPAPTAAEAEAAAEAAEAEAEAAEAAAVAAELAALESGGVDAATIASQVITLCPIGDDLRVRTQLTKLRTQLHAAQIALHRMGNELTQATSHLEMERSARVRLERCMEELEYAAAGELDVRMSPRIIEGCVASSTNWRIDGSSSWRRRWRRSVNEMKKVQASSWGAWAEDRALAAERERLVNEVNQAHTLNKRLTQVSSSKQPQQQQHRHSTREHPPPSPPTHYSLPLLPSPYTHTGARCKYGGGEAASITHEEVRSDLQSRLDRTTKELAETVQMKEALSTDLEYVRSECLTHTQTIAAYEDETLRLKESLHDREAQVHTHTRIHTPSLTPLSPSLTHLLSPPSPPLPSPHTGACLHRPDRDVRGGDAHTRGAPPPPSSPQGTTSRSSC